MARKKKLRDPLVETLMRILKIDQAEAARRVAKATQIFRQAEANGHWDEWIEEHGRQSVQQWIQDHPRVQ